jgi:protein-disulfide isomerase
MSSTPPPSKAERREQAKAAAAALRAAQARDAARQRTIMIGSIVLGLVILVVLVIVVFSKASSPSTSSTTDGAAAGSAIPAVASARGGVVFDQSGVLTPVADDTWPGSLADGGPVVVSVYFDFMCPWCGVFEQTQGELLDTLRASGDIVVDSHPVAILDRFSNGTQYSSRATAAAFAVADGSPEHYFEFIGAMMAEGVQPEENSDGLTSAEIAAIAAEVGVPQEVQDLIVSGEYLGYSAAATELASQDLGRLSTPTILINGQSVTDDLGVNWTEPGAFEAAIRAAQG